MSVLARTLPPHGKARGPGCWVVVACVASIACAPAEPETRWHESAWAASRPALVAFLEELATLSDTRIAREARTALGALPDCPVLGARAPAGDPVPGLEALACLAPDDPLGQEVADAALVFQWAQSPAWRLRGRGVRDAEGWKFEARWEDPPSAGPLALLVPSTRAPGPDRLAASGRLVHLRMRPEGGLDLAALAPPGSQGDRLFRLRSGLFAAAILAGDFEAAIYEPESDGDAPRVAIALGIRSRATAAPAVERFVADLRTTWSVTPSPLSTPQGDGACLLGLRLLPEFAPCYVTGEEALWVSWNPASLRQAIATPASTTASRDVGRASLDLRAIETTDALLARASGVEGAPTPLDWPWEHAELELQRAEDGVQIGLSLRTANPPPVAAAVHR
ncbi:MAG: hypothetical protein AAF430_10990 [Myxococcota bacterium]